ncbi:cytochrome c oxidase subunit 3 [Limobrevibacterium gyesilva]|uniref:Cytochrome c oxidase subunit 3 n=1 Tax=Limobrevibacterium gyesilva TaxID=2991712 RepID=A0AA42CCH2_9PROT|nr:cytochrome c oxidase subunit 3 [Limobrevibacterium gyesilva]MCW3473358.1 cytochrome c oxidase subunit 3 [Limobrevibacterium gyesilva]
MSSDAHGATTLPASSGLKQPYHLVDPSPWPLLGSLGGGLTVLGIILAAHYGSYITLVIGVLVILGVMFFWWRDVLKESRTAGMHTPIVRIGLRYGMTLFIASEVMFFAGFFWAYFHFALFPEHVLGVENPTWPPAGIHTFDPWHLPFLNTMILLLSGTTITWAHHSLLAGDRKGLITGLALTVALGLTFTTFQAIEYSEAPFHFSGGGIYPSVFFLATGFHGFHVIVGTCFLIVCLLRAMNGQFTPQRHFGFEAAAWYWHFVDVVWLFLFICIYWWGAGVIVGE